jgi:nicotinate-nucleotide adenylyltransferase
MSVVLRTLEPPSDAGPVRIAHYGGSFNPIHLGHLRIAQELLDLHGFRRVIFVPNGNEYRKTGLIDEKHRARMVELALAGEPRFEMCSYELNREQVVRTHQTAAHLRERLATDFPSVELYLIRGSDVIKKMLRWRTYAEVVRSMILVPTRPGVDPLREFGDDERFRQHADRFRLLPRPYDDGLSSSEIRQRVERGLSARFLVPEAVERYILEQHLYR